MKKILVIEDDYALAMGIQFSLKAEDFDVVVVHTLENADKILINNDINLILLDVMLPDGNGYDYCKSLIERNIEIPIIFLTAISDEANIVQGLDIGADDYITKPFGVKELSSRIKATLRRYEKNSKVKNFDNELLTISELVINKKKNSVTKNGEEIILTPSEYRLLIELIENKNTILERNVLIERLWDIDGSFVDDNTLSVYIKRLRNKIENDPSNPKYILTVRGVGYTFKEI
jgi:DNA-binding response OmpR family regulator